MADVRRFDPGQERDPDGKWGDGVPGPNAPGMSWSDVIDLYGTTYDEAVAGDFTVAVFERGDFTLFFQNEHGRYEPVRELDPDVADEFADRLDEFADAAEEHEFEPGEEESENAFDYLHIGEDNDTLVGYTNGGTVMLSVSKSGEHLSDLEEAGNDKADQFWPLPADARDLAQAIRDMVERYDELNDTERSRAVVDMAEIRRYNPSQPRDPGGEGGGQWTSGPGGKAGGALKDALKLAGKIDLAAGEKLVGSDKVTGDGGSVRLAVTEHDGERSIRLGVGDPTFGSRDDDAGPWRAGPDPTAAINAERKRLRNEEDALRDEWEQADPERKAAIDTRLDEIDDLETGEVYPSGYTAKLDQPALDQLRSKLTDALADGVKTQAVQDAYWDKYERLDAELKKLKHMGRKWTDEEDALWDSLTAQLDALEANKPEDPDYQIFGEGVIAGDWADVHYRVELDDPSIGVRVYLGAVPHDSGLDLDQLSGDENAAIFDPAETKKLLRLLDKMASGGVAATFDPHQKRDENGQWVDQFHTPGSSLKPRQIGHSDTPPPDAFAGNWDNRMSLDQYGDTYGDVHDERDVDEFVVVEFERGDFHIAVEDPGDPGHRYVMAELSTGDARDIADALDWATDADPAPTGEDAPAPDPDFGDLVDWRYAGEDTVVGYDTDGSVVVGFPRSDAGFDVFAIEFGTAIELRDALNDMADLHEERENDTGLVAAAAGRRKTVAAKGRQMPASTTADAVRAAWNETAPHQQWVTEIAPDMTYVVVVEEPARTFARHQVHVSARGQITFGRGRPIRLGYVDASGAVSATRTVFASRDESRPVAASGQTEPAPAAVTPPATELPAAEPEPTTEPKEGDTMSTLSEAMCSRLGLAEGADEVAALAAIDALKAKVEAPPTITEPNAEQVAASAARDEENASLKKEVKVLASQMEQVTAELAATKAEKAATVKASVLDEAQRLGKFTPAARPQWDADYDEAPAAITRVLASIAAGTAVPVAAAGHTGAAEPTGDSFNDAEYTRLFGEKASA